MPSDENTGQTAVDRCEMPECFNTERLKDCRGPKDMPIRACWPCRMTWPRQLRVIES